MNAILGIVRPGRNWGFDYSDDTTNPTRLSSGPHTRRAAHPGAVYGSQFKLTGTFFAAPARRRGREADGSISFDHEPGPPIDRARGGSFSQHGRPLPGLCYIRTQGPDGLSVRPPRVSGNAIVLARVKDVYRFRLELGAHARVRRLARALARDPEAFRAMGPLAKAVDRLQLPRPHVYFPLNRPEGLMIEPTETERRERKTGAFARLAQIAGRRPESPHTTHRHTTPSAVSTGEKAAKSARPRVGGRA